LRGLSPPVSLQRDRGSDLVNSLTTLDEAKKAWLAREPRGVSVIDGELAGISFSIDFDDAAIADALFLMFGGGRPRSGVARSDASLTASIRSVDAPFGWGLLLTRGSAHLPIDGREFTFAVSMDDGPFDATAHGAWTFISFRGEQDPLIAYDHEAVLFRTGGEWQKAIVIYLFCRLQRAREDVIFLHAGSVAIDGRGILFIGPKGAGKSTTVMGLAARGHRFLGDECGAYLPASRSLLPFRRPVGIKPGPRSGRTATALPRAQRVVSGEGFIRVALDELLDIDGSDKEAALDAVVFLRGFRAEPQLTAIVPSREDIAAMQPIAGSLINAAGTKRVFQLLEMLAHARVFALHPGEPDPTSVFLEEALSS
jgi:hypothetical protein